MNPRNALRSLLTVGTLTAALVGAGTGAAWAGTPNPAPRPVAFAAPAPRPGPRPAPQPAPGPQPARVVGANARSLTVRGPDGRTAVFALTPRTEIVKFGRRASPAQLVRDDRVQVAAARSGPTPAALRVVDTGR